MTFTTIPLISGGYLVKGTDAEGNKGTTILTSERWDAVQHLRSHKVATEDFDRVVEEFFAPLTEAADKAKALVAGPAQEWNTVTFGEKVEGSELETYELDNDGILLNILDAGQSDLLRWVGDDQLVAIQV